MVSQKVSLPLPVPGPSKGLRRPLRRRSSPRVSDGPNLVSPASVARTLTPASVPTPLRGFVTRRQKKTQTRPKTPSPLS